MKVFTRAVLGVMTMVVAAAVPVSASAATQPYFNVVGGDVVAGASFATPAGTVTTPCAAAPHLTTAGAVSWNNHSGYSGAGAQYGVQANGLIQDIVSGQGFGREPNNLSFSNTESVDIGGGLFGGKANGGPCLDYWAQKPTSGTGTFIGGAVSDLNGNYVSPPAAKLVISASSIKNGNHSTIYVDGDVAIVGNITYANTSWPDRDSIPSFRLIVHGNIYVQNAVTQLDGTYVAVPNTGYATTKNEFTSPIAGTISTCSIGFDSYNVNNYVDNRIESACGNKLAVNGSLAANQIWLLRSTGSLASKVPAETITYTPDTWIAPGSGGASSSVDNSVYQSVVGLPPIL